MNEDIGRLKSKVRDLEARVAFLENQLSVSVDLIARSPSDPESSIVKCRVLLERVVKDLYGKLDVPLPGKAHELGALLNNSQFARLLPPRVVLRMNSVREYGNLGAHDKGPVTTSDALDCLNCMVEIVDWYCSEHRGVETEQGAIRPQTHYRCTTGDPTRFSVPPHPFRYLA